MVNAIQSESWGRFGSGSSPTPFSFIIKRAASLEKRFGKAEPERSLFHTQIAHYHHHLMKTLANGFFGFTARPFKAILNLLVSMPYKYSL